MGSALERGTSVAHARPPLVAVYASRVYQRGFLVILQMGGPAKAKSMERSANGRYERVNRASSRCNGFVPGGGDWTGRPLDRGSPMGAQRKGIKRKEKGKKGRKWRSEGTGGHPCARSRGRWPPGGARPVASETRAAESETNGNEKDVTDG